MARNPFSLSVIRTASQKLPSKTGLRNSNTAEEKNTDLIMTDSSMLVTDTGRSLLGDSSVLDSKIIETSKENIFIGLASDVEEEMPQIETRVVLVQEAGKHEELLKALEEIKVPYIKMESVEEFGDSESPEFETVFVVADFQDSILENLCKFDCRVLGPPIVLHCAQKGEPLPFSCRPLYCASMLNLVLCFTGFRKKEELVKLVTLVHHMGGIIRRDFSSKVTHLVANSTQGDKFRLAVSLGTPIVKAEWIYKAWERRNEIDFCAADEEFRNEFKVPPFQDCMLSFLGFSDEERINMEEMTKMQGGQYLPVSDDRCTHLVVEENTVKDLPFEPPKKLYVVKQEWFWGSIQMDARAGESMYLFEKPESPELKKSVSQLSLNTPNSNRKRRRLRETLAQLTRETDMSPFPPRKRPSAEHSLSMGSLLDISNTPESSITNGGSRIGVRCSDPGRGQASCRHVSSSSQTWRKMRKKYTFTKYKPPDNVTPKQCVNPVESLQQTNKVASIKSSGNLGNSKLGKGTVSNLQKKILFPKESKEIIVRPTYLEALKDTFASCQRLVGTNNISNMPQDCEEPTCLTYVDQLTNTETNISTYGSCGKEQIAKSTISQLLELGLQNKSQFQRTRARSGNATDVTMNDLTCMNTCDYVQQVTYGHSHQGKDSKDQCSFINETSLIEETNILVGDSEPPSDSKSKASYSDTSAALITETPKSCSKPSKNSTPLPAKQSARWQVAKELYQTESNYVDILTTIIQLFQVPLEKEGQLGGPILAQEEIKTIFGSIPDILDVHTKIKEDLEDLMINWAESKSIGDVILKYSKDLLKTYPPFVNFFEMSKETIMKCEKQKPRFHAFLKINQAKPECGRQSLAELLIRPVQRLPSVALLLNDLKKHTAEDNPDKGMLERAIESLKEVMTHINEDKRKTEAQRLIFDVVYEVDGCPANLLSSHRSLVQRLETVALGDDLCDRGEQVTLFLFNDCLEIARKRHKVISAFKSPHGQTRPPASLKHIVLMPLSQIKKVLDIRETEDCHKAFALVVRPPTEQNNLLFSFQMTTEEPPKEDWLKMLCRHVANTICKADAENLIYTTDPDSIDINTKDVDSTLSRASRAIKKTSKKVTRAFSFSKTPKRALRRALMAHNTVEGRSPCSASERYLGSRLTSTSSLAIARSSSTYSLNGSVKHVVSVQRSNSVDGSSQSSRSRPVLCPGSPTSHPSHAREGKTPSSPESLNGHSLARPCPIPVITTTCDVGDDQSGVENSSVVKL
ncbi:protein ECT2 isoform X2 [Mauremys reevesii]|uniref:protein ECT2 isoform X2 n=1 Tax=Mauremys reevesii TaxID=260615 RepID=UPI00193EE5D7|nr:protein ECT2 isoform X2 [Mauremys reevesii]